MPPTGVFGINIDLPSPVALRGTVTKAGGLAVPSPTVKACVVGHDGCFADYWSWSDGSYLINVAPNRRYTITVEGGDSYASGYYDSDKPGNFTLDPEAATVVSVTTSNIVGLDITLPYNVQIGGFVVNPAYVGIYGVQVGACDSYRCYTAYTNDGGYYTANVPPNDDFYVSFADGIGTYAAGYFSASSSNGFSADPDDATVVSVDSTSINGIAAALPLAVHVSGKVTNVSGTPLLAVDAYACIHPVAGSCYVQKDMSSGVVYGFSTGVDGTFSIAVAPHEAYYIYLVDSSGTYAGGFWSSSGYTPYLTSATKVTIGTANVTGINLSLPSAVRISGQVTDSAGDRLTFVDVWACEVGTSGCFYVTAFSGQYSVAVLPNHSYILEFDSNSARHLSGFYDAGGLGNFTVDQAQATVVHIASGSLTGVDIALPSPVAVGGHVTDTAAVAIAPALAAAAVSAMPPPDLMLMIEFRNSAGSVMVRNRSTPASPDWE